MQTANDLKLPEVMKMDRIGEQCRICGPCKCGNDDFSTVLQNAKSLVDCGVVVKYVIEAGIKHNVVERLRSERQNLADPDDPEIPVRCEWVQANILTAVREYGGADSGRITTNINGDAPELTAEAVHAGQMLFIGPAARRRIDFPSLLQLA